jgi:hypothetical protein
MSLPKRTHARNNWVGTHKSSNPVIYLIYRAS